MLLNFVKTVMGFTVDNKKNLVFLIEILPGYLSFILLYSVGTEYS